MAGSPRFLKPSLIRPPPHLEGKLLVQPCNSRKWPERYCVVLEGTLHCYKSERDYYKCHKAVLDINLEQVFEITESLHNDVPRKYSVNCVFKLRTEQTEVYLLAREREEAEHWISGLKRIKEFRKHCRRNQEYYLQEEQFEMERECSENAIEDGQPCLSLITIDGKRHTYPIKEDSVVEDLFFKISEHGDRKGSPCETCLVRKTGVEFWAVDSEGAGQKLEDSCSLLEVYQNYREIFLLESHHKLLIVHFEDGTFQICPKRVSITTREVFGLPILTEKLVSIDCDNPGLFLATNTGTEMPFALDDTPLEVLSGPRPYSRGKLVMKSRALSMSPDKSCREVWSGMAEKNRIQKMLDDRIHKQIEKNINNHNRRQKRRQEERLKKKHTEEKETDDDRGQDYEEGEAIPIKSKKAQLHKQNSLQFQEDHFAYGDTVIETRLGDFVSINYPEGCEEKLPEKALFGKENVRDDRSGRDRFSKTITSTEQSGGKLATSKLVIAIPSKKSGETHSTELQYLEEKIMKEETDRSVEVVVPRNQVVENSESVDTNIPESSDVNEVIPVEAVECYNAKFDDVPELLEKENEIHSETNKDLIFQNSCYASSVVENDDSTTNKGQIVDALDTEKVLSHDLDEDKYAARETTVCSESSDVAVECSVETKISLHYPRSSEDLGNCQVGQSNVEAVEKETADECISPCLPSSEVLRTTALSGAAINTQDVHEHCCNFYKVETPNILRAVLKSQNDEDEDHTVNANDNARICLSGSHFVYNRGKWHFQGNLEETEQGDADRLLETFRLNGNMVIAYDKANRRWIVSKIRNEGDSLGKNNSEENSQSRMEQAETSGQSRTCGAKRDKESSPSGNAENTETDVKFPSTDNIKKMTISPYVTRDNVRFESERDAIALRELPLQCSNLLKNSPLDNRRQDALPTRKLSSACKEDTAVTTTNRRTGADSSIAHVTVKPVVEGSTKHDKTVNKLLRSQLLEEEDTVSFCRSGSLRSKLQTSSFSSEDEPEAFPLGGSLNSLYTRGNAANSKELSVVRDVYKQITRHMSALNPEDALDDTRCKVVGELIYDQLVQSLWDLISRGLRKSKFWQSKITPWSAVGFTKCLPDDIIRLIEVTNCYALTDEQKFKFFVCKCLNCSKGTLETWFALYYRQLNTANSAVRKCYEEDYEDATRMRGSVLEDIISEVSRLSYLPFRLSYPRQVQERAFQYTCQTMVSYE